MEGEVARVARIVAGVVVNSSRQVLDVPAQGGEYFFRGSAAPAGGMAGRSAARVEDHIGSASAFAAGTPGVWLEGVTIKADSLAAAVVSNGARG